MRPPHALFARQVRQQRDRLDRLAQAHLVGQDAYFVCLFLGVGFVWVARGVVCEGEGTRHGGGGVIRDDRRMGAGSPRAHEQ